METQLVEIIKEKDFVQYLLNDVEEESTEKDYPEFDDQA